MCAPSPGTTSSCAARCVCSPRRASRRPSRGDSRPRSRACRRFASVPLMGATLLVTAHDFAVFWLVIGIVGRDTCWGQARLATDLTSLRAIASVASIFDRTMVRPSSFAVLLTGGFAAWLRGWPPLGFLQGGSTNWLLV